MDDCKYNLKISKSMDEMRYEVTDSELVMRSYNKGTRRIALKVTESVRLTRVQGRTFCTVKARGAKPIVVISPAQIDKHYTAEAAAQYVTFLECLHQKIVASGARTRWMAGSNFLYSMGVLSFVLMFISIAVFLFALIATGKFTPQFIFPITLLGMIGLPLMYKGKATTYSPDRMPSKYLFDR